MAAGEGTQIEGDTVLDEFQEFRLGGTTEAAKLHLLWDDVSVCLCELRAPFRHGAFSVCGRGRDADLCFREEKRGHYSASDQRRDNA